MSRTLLLARASATLASFTLGGCMSMITGGPLITDRNAPTGQIVVRNASNISVNAVLVSACSASTYGLNRMGRGERIGPGEQRAFTVTAGCWDVAAGSTATGHEARQRMQVPAGSGVVYTVQ